MNVIYDLSKSPITHDILCFLARAERFRLESNKGSLQVGIVVRQRYRSHRDMIFDLERRKQRAVNLLIPLCFLLPSVTSASLVDEGIQSISYKPNGPITDVVLKPNDMAKRDVESFLRNKLNPVTITIRDFEFETFRNSNQEEWNKVSWWLQERGFTPIIIPDSEALMVGKPCEVEGRYFPAASFRPDVRLALYERCLNVMVCHGPSLIALMGNTKTLLFHWWEDAAFKKYGLDQPWPGKSIYQERDNAETIISRIKEAV